MQIISGTFGKEITKSNRWCFYDNGIRNAIISNFNRLDNRIFYSVHSVIDGITF
jgi:hypothetical protein